MVLAVSLEALLNFIWEQVMIQVGLRKQMLFLA
jgi:hypothetical protein